MSVSVTVRISSNVAIFLKNEPEIKYFKMTNRNPSEKFRAFAFNLCFIVLINGLFKISVNYSA